ncbi:integrase arm-type DNA-binding domain-containing protein [Moraxella nasovis]|uniref:tyrosine-type recombinase/integrase n=1 Tax=Moraxella nasovis TaxID=2904121 RepID=UPI001F605774|nr:site-specific integrase [Moraxella nasovis]UNU74151.1 integrase arm-type DNA-binding domain-containing protein [Moraxella nasovis]
MTLTESWLKANNGKHREKVEEFADRDAMSVRISPKGKIVFQLRYRFGGKAKRLDIGTYPLMTLKKARERATEYRALLDENKDPKFELTKNQAVKTFKEIFELWYDNYCIKNKQSASQIKRSIERHVYPKFGSMPADKITLQHWLDLIEPIAESTPAMASRILLNVKQTLKWAVKRQYIPHNPLSDIFAHADLGIRKNKKERVLSDDELVLIFVALRKSRITFKNRCLVELCLMFGCRKGELLRASKNDFDFDKKVWTVPVENNKVGKKTGRKIIRPILPEQEKLLLQLIKLSEIDCLFPREDNTGSVGGNSNLTLPINLRQFIKRYQGVEIPNWSMHDLRRTARTNFSKFTTRDVAEIMLGHTLAGEQATYDYYDYLDEQRLAYRKWIDKINELKAISELQ